MAVIISEAQMRPVVLQLLARANSGFLPTSAIIAELEDIFKPEGEDADPVPDRSETRFSHKVRNVCRGDRAPGLVAQGLAVYHADREGVEITAAGRAYVKKNGL